MNRNKLISNIIFALVIMLTVGTSAYAANELYKSVNNNDIKLSSIKSVKNGESSSKTKSVLDMSTKSNLDSNNNCYIVVNGNTYDVLNFRKVHSGGDIFVCNTDMTEKFNSMHGNNYSLIKPYLVTDSSVVMPSKSSTSNSLGTKTVSKNNLTLAQLKTHNVSGNCYVAFKGTIYNVSNNPAWANCTHNGMVGGTDITSKFPHPTSYLSTLPVIGILSGTVNNQNTNNTGGKIENEFEDDKKEEDDDYYDKLENEKEYEYEYEFEFED